MPRRIIAVALPWLAAEHRQRAEGQSGLQTPFAVVEMAQGAVRLTGVNNSAAKAGLGAGQTLTDARAICPDLLTRPAIPERLDAFHKALIRWAERFSPLVGSDARHALILNATGCAHLFGGEEQMLTAIINGLGNHGITARAAIADTKGAAWALAHFNGIRIAGTARTRQALADLPVAALRIDASTVDALARTGLTTIEPLTRMARGALARRFGIETMRRLDQALGAEAEAVAPDRPLPSFSARMTLPEPIGLEKDVIAGLDRLLERLCRDLERHQMGARSLCLTARRVDGTDQHARIGLARAGRDPMRLRELFRRKVSEIEAGWGIDALRLVAVEIQPLKPAQLIQAHRETEAQKLDDLISRLGNCAGFDNILRLLPAESHIPERSFLIAPAAHSTPGKWATATACKPRPIALFRPEGIPEDCSSIPLSEAGKKGTPPKIFQWRGQRLTIARAYGPERLAPEWWWDDPDWRSGPRDYWRIETTEGPRLWLFHTPAHPAWYAQGSFA
ncbi:MAG: DNA polymerase Y family protein [Pseudomonadota bacterium]